MCDLIMQTIWKIYIGQIEQDLANMGVFQPIQLGIYDRMEKWEAILLKVVQLSKDATVRIFFKFCTEEENFMFLQN